MEREQERSLEGNDTQINDNLPLFSIFFFFFLISEAGYRAEQRPGGWSPVSSRAASI